MAAVAIGAPASAFADVLTPESPHSPNAGDIRDAYVVIGVIVTIIAIAAIASLLVAMRRFRATAEGPRNPERSARRVQPYVALGLSTIAAVIFVIGAVYTEGARDVEPTGTDGLTDANPLEIQVSGQQWLWRYEYPEGLGGEDGEAPIFSYHELVVPVDTSVALEVLSVDVMHRWSVPALAPMVTAVPGETNATWFKADEEGVYEGRTQEYSGPGTAAMRTRVRVVSTEEFRDWASRQAADIQAAQDAVQEAVDEGTAPGVAR